MRSSSVCLRLQATSAGREGELLLQQVQFHGGSQVKERETMEDAGLMVRVQSTISLTSANWWFNQRADSAPSCENWRELGELGPMSYLICRAMAPTVSDSSVWMSSTMDPNKAMPVSYVSQCCVVSALIKGSKCFCFLLQLWVKPKCVPLWPSQSSHFTWHFLFLFHCMSDDCACWH